MSGQALTVVVGLGKTGMSCVRYCVERNIPVAVTDSRENPPGVGELRACYPRMVIKLGGFDTTLLAAASRIIISPGVSLKEPNLQPAIAKGIPIVGDVEIFCREVKAPIIAITGSNGKSTVTTMVGEMARKSGVRVKVGGNIGVPVLDLLDRAEPELYVLELSSFQLESTPSLAALASVNLNLSPDHMDRYATLRDYQEAKLQVYHQCGTAVINLDDPMSYGESLPAKDCLRFSVADDAKERGADFYLIHRFGDTLLAFQDQPLMAISELPFVGRHQMANALSALALGTAAGLSMDAMIAALKTFKGLPHRCQFVAEHGGVRWYNDSKATNVGATTAALAGVAADCKGDVILLAGGQGKDADFSPLRSVVADHVSKVILFGEDRFKLYDVLQDVVAVTLTSNLAEAVEEAHSVAQKGDMVILSPACASFDMFKNFEDRGNQFMSLVKAIS
ncbi:MAG: UDP-N-acetylmuramoyl-L-alanine--D-glutamate ligase [Pseudomonadota bacterium]|nr:UDP-N-acetylmuramoyl-L-alanine--D-glutamate ligase [Pseudomonadota bacterium]